MPEHPESVTIFAMILPQRVGVPVGRVVRKERDSKPDRGAPAESESASLTSVLRIFVAMMTAQVWQL